jgi:cation:H+ antiporter
MLNFILFIISLVAVVKSAGVAVRYATQLARLARVTEYIIGFVVVAVISVFPETFISIMSALQGVPSFGLGTLFGSNVADLTLVFAIVVLFSGGKISIASKVIKEFSTYLGVLFVPLLFGFDGFYSRIDGLVLVFAGVIFYILLLQEDHKFFEAEEAMGDKKHPRRVILKSLFILTLSLGVLFFTSYATVKFGVALAKDLRVSPTLIGLLFVALGTTMPELFFSLRAARKKRGGLALGDILGTVITDATIIVGLIALIKPFAFNPNLVYVTGVFMILAAIVLFFFMRTGRELSRKEGMLLILFYLLFIWAELAANK